jgi:ribosomal protein S18 acetylase RimI-like enzyme
MNISYKTGLIPNVESIIELYKDADLNRPVNDKARIKKMYENSNLIVSAWIDNELIGISRALTDYCYCCYLSDLAVKKSFQSNGIGRELIRLIKEAIGDESMLLLLSAPAAIDYYPHVGFDKVENGFIIKRKL